MIQPQEAAINASKQAPINIKPNIDIPLNQQQNQKDLEHSKSRSPIIVSDNEEEKHPLSKADSDGMLSRLNVELNEIEKKLKN